jgi:putative membrane protein insertion efficiency factor
MRTILIALVRSYQMATINISPKCKYYPSCSNYAITAVGRYGVKGIAMAAWRIMRCNPWSLGGVDYVDEHLDCADVKNLVTNNQFTEPKKEVVGAN